MPKPTPCNQGPRHSWVYSHDVTLFSRPAKGVLRLEKRGVYVCACKQEKHGTARSGPVFG